jgi:hypothetical protein
MCGGILYDSWLGRDGQQGGAAVTRQSVLTLYPQGPPVLNLSHNE